MLKDSCGGFAGQGAENNDLVFNRQTAGKLAKSAGDQLSSLPRSAEKSRA
jgi:hypothetical protein